MNNLLILYQITENFNQTSKKCWETYCIKNNIKFLYFNDIVNSNLDRTNQIFYFFKILESNNLKFDQICFVSDTTLISKNTPNPFNMTNNKLTFAEWDGDFGYLLNNIEIYKQYYFKDKIVDFNRFFDIGFFIINNSHKEIFNNITSFLEKNYNELKNKLDTSFIPQNFFFDCEYNKLPYTYNMIDMNRKEIVFDENLIKLGNIFNFKLNFEMFEHSSKFI